MSPMLSLPWPFGGVSEHWAFDDQPPQTTSDAANVRNFDHVSKRVRGAKRPGRSKQNETAVSNLYMVREILPVPYTNPTVDYTLSPSSMATVALPGGGECRYGECDADGNLYVLDPPAAISKLSSSLTLMQTFQVPVKSGASVVTLDVDEGANVFCGVGGTRAAPAGLLGSPEPANGMLLGDKDKAQLFKLRHAFRQNDPVVDPELEVAWTLTTDPKDAGPTLWGLVQFVRVKNGRLYTIQADNRQWKNWLVVYDAIHAGVPVQALVMRLPYPASSLDVAKNGRIVVTVESFSRRGENPEHPECTADLLAWDPTLDIDEDVTGSVKKHRFWNHYKVESKYLRTTGGLTPEDGDEVLYWLDAGPGGRHLKFAVAEGKKPPIYRANGLAGRPALLFDGETHLLAAPLGPSKSAEFRDAGRGIFPAYSDPDDAERSAQFAAFCLMRPERTTGSALADQFPAWDAATSYSTLLKHHSLLINRKASETLADAANTESGSVSWFLRASAADKGEGSANGLMPAWYKNAFNNTANALLVTLLADNGVDAGNTSGTRALWRVWGRPVDRFTQEGDTLKSASVQPLGGFISTDFSTMTLFKGELYELLVLDRKSLDVEGAASILGHPLEPDEDEGSIVGQVVIAAEGTGGSNLTDQPLAFSTSGGSPTVQATGTWTSLNGKITSVKITSVGSGYTHRPTVTATGYTGADASLLAGMSLPAGSRTPTTMEKIEGYFAWKYGLGHMLAGEGIFIVSRVNSSGTEGVYHWSSPHPHPWAQGMGTFDEDLGVPENENTVGLHRFSHYGESLIVLDASGKLLDVKSHTLNGVGLGCRFNADGTVLYTAGNTGAPDAEGISLPSDSASIRKWTVNKDGTLTSAWVVRTSLQMSGQTCGLKVDKEGNVYVPCNAPIDTTDAKSVLVFASDATLIHEFSEGSGTANQGTFCVVLPRAVDGVDLMPTNPEYGDDLTNKVSDFFWLLGSNQTYAGAALDKAARKYQLVLATPNGEPPRLRADTAVANGSIYRFDEAGPPVVISGGLDALRAASGASDYVHTVDLLQKGYYTDGTKDVVYDPKLGTIVAWAATHGTLPPRCRILEEWRGRLVRTGDQDFPGAVHLSKTNDPLNWDTSPPVPTLDQACDFATTEVGDMPDLVNGFVPYNDDVAVIGCDSTIWVLRGDPMMGGQKDLISDITGMAFGRAWCKDPEGRIWFFGSRGGLYTMAGPTAVPERVSRFKIEGRLSSLDLAANFVRLTYDADSDGIWIDVMTYAAPAASVETYFYELAQGAFWPDNADSLGATVTARAVIDGDEPDDRRVLTGHADGFVRYVDPESSTDDGVPIRSRVLIGPVKSPIEGQEVRTLKLGVTLASEQNGLSYAVYASDRADDKGAPKRQGEFAPGANLMVSARTCGSYVWLELVQTSGPSRFAFERAWFEVERAGIQRIRS